jgi:hypothetical protein
LRETGFSNILEAIEDGSEDLSMKSGSRQTSSKKEHLQHEELPQRLEEEVKQEEEIDENKAII